MPEPTLSPALLTKALLKATEQLGISADLQALLQIPAEQTSQLQSGARLLDPTTEQWHRASKLVSLVRVLVPMLGTIEQARAWLQTPNDVLGTTPIDMLKTTNGERVYRYLTAVQNNELRLPGVFPIKRE